MVYRRKVLLNTSIPSCVPMEPIFHYDGWAIGSDIADSMAIISLKGLSWLATGKTGFVMGFVITF